MKKDVLTKQYLSQPEVFADAFNYFLFDGRQVIHPGDLKEQDSNELAVINKMGKLFTDQKMRDVLKLCTIRRSKKATFVLLGIEAQDRISYVMPVRDCLYDALNYTAQIEAIRKEHMVKGDLKNGAEYLSGFTKKDRILPVITLCICFDKAKWDGPRSLSDMFARTDTELIRYVNDYRLNLITPAEINDAGKFASELGLVMEFIQNADDREWMRDIMKKEGRYSSVDVNTVDIINTYTNARISTMGAKEGRVNMCKGIQGLEDEARAEGRAEGEDMLVRLLKVLTPGSKEYEKALNASSADRRKMYKKYNITA